MPIPEPSENNWKAMSSIAAAIGAVVLWPMRMESRVKALESRPECMTTEECVQQMKAAADLESTKFSFGSQEFTRISEEMKSIKGEMEKMREVVDGKYDAIIGHLLDLKK